MKTILLCIYFIVLILILDIIWLSLMKQGYRALVLQTQGSELRISILPALLSYICVFLGLWYFAIPLIEQHHTSRKVDLSLLWSCFLYGGGLGFVTYGIFNFTNMAIFKNYRHWIMYADIMWGVILGTLAPFMYYIVAYH